MSELQRELQYGIPRFGVLIPVGFERISLLEEDFEESIRLWTQSLGEGEALDRVLDQLERLRWLHEQQRAFGALKSSRRADLPLPLSMVFSDFRVRPGRSVAQELHALQQEAGAEIPADDPRMVRWRTTEPRGAGDEASTVTCSRWVIPVPDAGQKKALLMTAEIIVSADGQTLPEEELSTLVEIADAVAGSFTWLDRPCFEMTDEQLAEGALEEPRSHS